MGVAGLWEVLKPAAETRSMTELAVTEGFIPNLRGLRGFRIGIDASIWFFHAEYGKEGENPVLRTLFFRCATLMRTTFLPLFVFDGPKRPGFKRGKKINKTNHKLIPGMKSIIEAFGFEWRIAPAEAEAELAYLNSVGIIDAVLSDDVDNFLFGATTIIRNISNNLSGNKANPILNSQGKDDRNHARLYRASKIHTHSSISLTRGDLILIGLLSGGDYAQAGLPGCCITTAHALARCGFGDTLYEAATTLSRDALPQFLTSWRQGLREELRTNSQGIIGRKFVKLAKEVSDSFPDMDILLSYTSPITSESLGRAVEKNLKLTWGKEPDVGKLATICEFYFEWGYKDAIIKRFRTLLWHSITLRILRRAVINAEVSAPGSPSAVLPSTPRKGKDHAHPRIINTPSKMVAKYFASMALDSPKKGDSESDDKEPLIIKIHSARNHASTDGLLEYRLEIAPAQLVRFAEAGIKGTREPPEKDEWAFEEETGGDDDGDDAVKRSKGPKPPPDPASRLRLWMPACMVEIAEPEIVEEFKERKLKKAAKKKGKTGEGSPATKQTKTKLFQSLKPLYDSDADQRLTIEDTLKRSTTMHSTPSRTADVRKRKVQAIREESRAESSKAAAERDKRKKSSLNHLSLSCEDEEPEHVNSSFATLNTSEIPDIPMSFPISLDNDDDVLSPSDTHGRLTMPRPTRPTKTSLRSMPSQASNSRRHGSPHKIRPVKRLTRSSSPSRIRPAHGPMAIKTTVIEISSDDSNSDSGPSAVFVQRSAAPSLILAEARSRNKEQSNKVGSRAKTKQASRDGALPVIDLT